MSIRISTYESNECTGETRERSRETTKRNRVPRPRLADGGVSNMMVSLSDYSYETLVAMANDRR